jgi:hypothetical protein
MASTLDQACATNLLNAMFVPASFTAYTAPTTVRLMTAQGSATAAGTEVTGGSYARQNFGPAAPSSGTASNAGAINFTSMPAASVVAVELWDSSATPRRLMQGSLASNKSTNAGDTLSFSAAALQATLT